jgi:hypothetical protein
MRKLGLIVTVALVITALYYLSMSMFQPKTPQVVIVKPSGSQSSSTNQSGGSALPQPPVSVGGYCSCTKQVYLKVGAVSLCADVIYSVAKTDDSLHVDFQGGIVQGLFMFASIPSCTITTTPQGILIPCRAQIIIPLKQ